MEAKVSRKILLLVSLIIQIIHFLLINHILIISNKVKMNKLKF
jgi:hypothetical protein